LGLRLRGCADGHIAPAGAVRERASYQSSAPAIQASNVARAARRGCFATATKVNVRISESWKYQLRRARSARQTRHYYRKRIPGKRRGLLAGHADSMVFIAGHEVTETITKVLLAIIAAFALLIWHQPQTLYALANSIERTSGGLVRWLRIHAEAKQAAIEAYRRVIAYHREMEPQSRKGTS
jgi:hypothetical protein